ncbi:MAG: hypothetical protein J7K87_00535 [Candidatus Aenigmarchaeota archaeon]|nr:hypothetical protein [Candidatus Aenigmarchaeota archaeon]
MSSNKAQIFSPDFIMATIIFLFILVTLQVNNYMIREKIAEQQDMLYYDSLLSKTDILVLYSGYPKYWDASNVEVLGFAERPNILNETKIKEFVSMDENDIKKLLDIEGKSFYFFVKNSEGKIMYEKGSPSWENSDEVFVVKRDAVMNGKGVEMRFIVW